MGRDAQDRNQSPPKMRDFPCLCSRQLGRARGSPAASHGRWEWDCTSQTSKSSLCPWETTLGHAGGACPCISFTAHPCLEAELDQGVPSPADLHLCRSTRHSLCHDAQGRVPQRQYHTIMSLCAPPQPECSHSTPSQATVCPDSHAQPLLLLILVEQLQCGGLRGTCPPTAVSTVVKPDHPSHIGQACGSKQGDSYEPHAHLWSSLSGQLY